MKQGVLFETKLEEITGILKTLQSENKALRKEMVDLKKQLSSVLKEEPKGEDKLFGFTLSERKTGSEKAYWYAGKRINGKLIWIYIGKDKSKASSKIKIWLEKQYSKKKRKSKGKVKKVTSVKKQLLNRESASVVEEFYKGLEMFEKEARGLSNAFVQQNTLEELERAGKKFIENQKGLEEKLAAELSYLVEKGKLRTMFSGKYWKKYKLADFEPEKEIATILDNNDLTLKGLVKLGMLLNVKNKGENNKESWVDSISYELERDANGL